MTVPQTDTGRRVENTKANGRTFVKELGKLDPVTSGEGVPPCVMNLLSQHEGVAVNMALATGYQNHRSLLSRKTMYRG